MSNISTTSRFYRNRAQSEILLYLIKRKMDDIYHIQLVYFGVARGEEAYTMGMMINDAGIDSEKISIYGYDIDRECISIANKGRYNNDSFFFNDRRFIPDDVLSEYFVKEGSEYILSQKIMNTSHIMMGDVLNPPEKTGDFVFLQNVTCHMGHEDAARAISNVYRLTNNNGYMILGGYDRIREGILDEMYRNKKIVPIIVNLREIHEGWVDRIAYSDLNEPWVLGPIQNIPNYQLFYSSIFRKIGS